MDIRCPNCDQSFTTEPSSDDRYSCPGCQISLYLGAQSSFQAIAAIAFPPAPSAPVELKSFFFIAESTVPEGLLDGGVIVPVSQPERAGLSISSLETMTTVASASTPMSTLEQPAPPLPQPDSGKLDDEVELTSIAGGSFAAALTPSPLTSPPMAAASTMAPPPWEQAPANGHTEAWAVGPPALPPKAPPPLAKKQPKSAEDFARALGLPEISVQEPEHSMVPEEAPAVTKPGEDDDTSTPPKRTMMWVALAAVVLVAGAVFAAMRATPPPPPLPQPSVAPPQASSDAVASGPSLAPSGPSTTDAKNEVSAEKRAKAIDHYNAGNKLYLQRKYPAALDEFKKALEVDATFAYAHRGLGVTYAIQGKAELAIKEYKAYLKLAPDAKDAKQVEKMIKEFEK